MITELSMDVLVCIADTCMHITSLVPAEHEISYVRIDVFTFKSNELLGEGQDTANFVSETNFDRFD